jgi:hypothetical protein
MFDWTMVCDWEMTHLRKDVRAYILSIFSDKDFIANLPVYPMADVALKHLAILAEQHKFDIEINTAVFGSDGVAARTLWLNNLRRELHIEFDFNVTDSHGVDKPTKSNAIGIIEDNLHIIRKSTAPLAYIVHHHHNDESTNESFKDVFARSTRVQSLLDAVRHIEPLLYTI